MKIVLAYSGGLDTSCILKWLQETYNAEVITYCANVGQEEELDGLHEKAYATGAVKSYIEDLTEEFAKDYIFPMFQANAIYENMYLLGTSIARPLIAKSFPALLVIQRPVNHWISVSQPLDHCPLSRLKSAYAAER